MNLESFANSLQDQCNELSYLRERVAYLEKELAKYDQHMRDSNAGYEQMFGNILSIAVDPESYINKRMSGDVLFGGTTK